MSCDRCACEANVETAWGDWLCTRCYDAAPTTDPCPNCTSEPASATPVGVEGGSDAPAPSYSPKGAGAVIRPSLDDMHAALSECITVRWQFARDDEVSHIARFALGVFRDAVTACIEYRRLAHYDADFPGYQVIRTDVPNELAELAASVMRRVAR